MCCMNQEVVYAEYARRVRRGLEGYGDVHDAYSREARIVKAAICAGFYPQILRVENPMPKFTKVAGTAPALHESSAVG